MAESCPGAGFSRARLLVVGDLMLDRYWFGDVQRISPEAPVPVVRVTRSEERLGGAANVAFNAASLGVRATLVGAIGDDEPGRRIEALAREHGIDLHAVRDPQLATTIKLRVIGRQQQLLRVDFEQAPGPRALAHERLDAPARLVVADHADERRVHAERGRIERDVGGAPEPLVGARDAHDRHRRFG